MPSRKLKNKPSMSEMLSNYHDLVGVHNRPRVKQITLLEASDMGPEPENLATSFDLKEKHIEHKRMPTSPKDKGGKIENRAQLIENIPIPAVRKFKPVLANPEESRYPNFLHTDTHDSCLATEHRDGSPVNFFHDNNPGFINRDLLCSNISEDGQSLNTELLCDKTSTKKPLQFGFINSKPSKNNSRDILDGLEHEASYRPNEELTCHDVLDGVSHPLNNASSGFTDQDDHYAMRMLPEEFTIKNTSTNNQGTWHIAEVEAHILYPISGGTFKQQRLAQDVTTRCGNYETRDSVFSRLFNDQNNPDTVTKKLQSQINRHTKVLGAQLLMDSQGTVDDETIDFPKEIVAALAGLENMQDATDSVDNDDHAPREILKTIDKTALWQFHRLNENHKDSSAVYEVVMDGTFEVNYWASCMLAALKEKSIKGGLIQEKHQEAMDSGLKYGGAAPACTPLGQNSGAEQADNQFCSTEPVEVQSASPHDQDGDYDATELARLSSTLSQVSSEEEDPFALEKHLTSKTSSIEGVISPISSLQPDAHNLKEHIHSMKKSSSLLGTVNTLVSSIEEVTRGLQDFKISAETHTSLWEKLRSNAAEKKGLCDSFTFLNQQTIAVLDQIVYKDPFSSLTALRVLGSLEVLCSRVKIFAQVLVSHSSSKASIACMGSKNRVIVESLVKVQKNMTRLVNGIDRYLLLQNVEELKQDEGRRVLARGAAEENYTFNMKLSGEQKQLVNGGIRKLDIELHEVREQIEALLKPGARVRRTDALDLLTTAQEKFTAVVQNR